MSETTTQPLVGVGNIVHTEFISQDVDATRNFLGTVFDLKFENMPSDMGDYWTFGDAQLGIGGAVRGTMEHENAAFTAPYFNVANLDATITNAEAAGATTIVPKQPVPGMGYFAWFQAPGGIIVAAWENDETVTAPSNS